MSSHREETIGTAALAKAALRLLAERRLEPTPANYEQAWCRVSGEVRPLSDRDADNAVHLNSKACNSVPLWLVEGVIAQLLEQRLIWREQADEARQAIARADWMLTGQVLHSALANRSAINWGLLICQLQTGFVTAHQGWTAARKCEAVLRVVDSAGMHDEMLYERLHALIDCWKKEPIAEEIEPTITLWREQRDARLIAEMSALLSTLCDNLAGMSEQTSWTRGQVDLLRGSLQDLNDHRRLSDVRKAIAQNAESQQRLQVSRRSSVDEIKQMISTWIEAVGELSQSTDAFGTRIDGYVESISSVDTVEALSHTVRAMLTDTQTMSQVIQSSHAEMAAMRSRAWGLENEVSRLESELANASTQMVVDHLTQTMNRRGLDQAFIGAQERAKAFRSLLALAVIDLDDFKRVNDSLGHKGGDETLRQMAQIFKTKLRSSDAVARFGGEEFVLLLPDMTIEQSVAHLTKLQREVTAHVFMSDQNRMFITFSAGVTMVDATDSLTGAVERADRAMYAAKLAGKNCVRVV